jgi:predicted enzyme related to lactoylglutathione lyase
MRLNQVTVTAVDLDPAWDFYCTLVLVPIVDARPHYARFYCHDRESTFSLDQGDQPGRGTTVYFECDDLDGTVQRLKAAGLQFTSDPEDKSWL